MSPDDERKLTRRRFLEHTAVTSAMTATWYSVAMKTDALAQAQQVTPSFVDPGTGPSPYAYVDGGS